MWAIFFSTIQVAAYRRALGDWPDAAPAPDEPARGAAPPAERGSGRFDPRAIVLAALLATALLLASTSWALLLGVDGVADPGVAAVQARPRRRPARPAARRPARVRGADRRAAERRRAGADAAARAARRAARRRRDLDARGRRAGRAARGVPPRAAPPARAARPCKEAAALMEGLDPGPRLVAAARAAADRFVRRAARAAAAGRRRDRRGWPPSRPATARAPAPPGRRCGCARRTRCSSR